MIEIIIFFFLNLTAILLSTLLLKNNLLLNQSGEKHQKFVEKFKVPLLGGVYFLICFIYVLNTSSNFFLILFVLSIFILGIYSDLRFITSPKKRFFIQCVMIIFFSYFLDLKISSIRIEFLDEILNIKIINIFFVTFCLTILINGTNFIDGLNGLVIGYYLIISLIMYKLNFFENLNFTTNQIIIIILTFFMMLLMNLKKILFIGDSGSYLIGLVYGVLLTSHQENYNAISPYFIVLLVWYPCFENLFSIIRKFRFKKSPIYPDTNHLHQILFFYVKTKTNLSDITSNNLSTFIILLFTFTILYLGSLNIYSTYWQIFMILCFSIIYFFLYLKLLKFKLNFFK